MPDGRTRRVRPRHHRLGRRQNAGLAMLDGSIGIRGRPELNLPGPDLRRGIHMPEGGADIRFIQQLLGHEKLETTAIYTQVSIEQLKAVHSQTHPVERSKIGQDKPPGRS